VTRAMKVNAGRNSIGGRGAHRRPTAVSRITSPLTFCPTSSSCVASPVTAAPTTDLSSSPRLSKLGSTAVGAKTAYIERGSPWENGYVESFNARLRDELLIGEIFYTLREAQIVIESWRRHYNTIRPHASLGYKLNSSSFHSPHGSRLGCGSGSHAEPNDRSSMKEP
jgi:hypothetical protein